MTEPVRIYPEWVNPADPVAQRLAETLGRISGRVEHWQAEEREKVAALAWCRANGNPHKEQGNDKHTR